MQSLAAGMHTDLCTQRYANKVMHTEICTQGRQGRGTLAMVERVLATDSSRTRFITSAAALGGLIK